MSLQLREYLPLEQGLRPSFFLNNMLYSFNLREYLPLEQGLRRGSQGAKKNLIDSESIFH